MVRRLAVPVALTLLLAVTALWSPVAGRARGQSAAARTETEAARFWTPERMVSAMPDSGLSPRSAVGGNGGIPADPRTRAEVPDVPLTASGTAEHFAGLPSVGVLFSTDTDMTAHYCSASVVHSPGRDLILTAAHCGVATNVVFVPGYTKGALRQPYGVWSIGATFTDRRWQDLETGSDYDVTFARVEPDGRGRRIEDVTGANRLTRTPGWTNKITAVGYPAEAADPDGRAIRCTALTDRLPGLQQLTMSCGGYYTGTSGSPWLLDYDPRTRTGAVIGLVGGLDGGGLDDGTSYSPYFGEAVFALYRTAVRGGT